MTERPAPPPDTHKQFFPAARARYFQFATRYLRAITKGTRWAAYGLTGTALILVVGYVTPRTQARQAMAEEACAVTIYVGGDRLHTNLILPVKTADIDWQQHLNLTEVGQGDRHDYHYLSFGWGDRQFYLTTPDLESLDGSTTLRALLLPTETVMHVQGQLKLPPTDQSYRVEGVQVSAAGYRRLVTMVLESFAQTPTGEMQRVQESHRYHGSFYEGSGKYGIWRTCNDWVAAGLAIAGVQTPRWSGLSSSIFHHLKAHCTPD